MGSYWDETFLSRNNIGWSFPSANGGEEEGFNNPEINSFTGGLLSLTREVIQNSLDAAVDTDNPDVTIEFSLIQLPIKEAFPGREEYLERVKKCKDSSSIRTRDIIKRAVETLNSDSLATLKISDYNTTGLSNPGGRSAADSSFYSLLKGSGISAKNNGDGGSYGLGKIAPILCSGARAVFYYSQSINGERGFQGKGMLASHTWEDDSGEFLTRRMGYFGHCDKGLTPLTGEECNHLPDFINSRRVPGTDIFVLGISPEDAEDWNAAIKISIISDFFLSISQGRLRCRILEPDGSTTVISKETLKTEFSFFEEIIAMGGCGSDSDKDALRYYKAYTEGERFNADESSIIVGSQLYVLPIVKMPDYLFPKNMKTQRTRIYYSRKPGMKIYTRQCNTIIPSAVVFIGAGEKINSVLQSCEPAAHNAWDHKIILGNTRTNPMKQEARDCLAEIQRWINACLSSMVPKSDDDFDVAGLGNQLPMDQSLSEDPLTVAVHEKYSRKPSPFSFTSVGKQDDEGERGMSAANLIQRNKKESTEQELVQSPTAPASVTDEGQDGVTPNPSTTNNSSGGTPKMDNSKKPMDENESGNGAVPKRNRNKSPKSRSPKTVEFTNFRYVALREKGSYLIMFTPLKTIEEGKLYVNIVGDSDTELAETKSAQLIGGTLGSTASSKTKYIQLKNIPVSSKVKLQVILDYSERVSLSIAIDGDNNE